MSNEHNAAWGLVLPFDSDDFEFTRGFEMGSLWALTKDGAPEEPLVLHSSNVEMVLRIAEVRGLTATSEELDDYWMEVTFEEKP